MNPQRYELKSPDNGVVLAFALRERLKDETTLDEFVQTSRPESHCRKDALRRILLPIVAACLPLSAMGAPGFNPKPPAEVRHLAFKTVDRCSTRITSQASFKRGECGTSGCMNALLSCKVDGEAVVKANARAAIAMAEDRRIAENCASALSSLEEIVTNDLGPSEYDGAAEGSFDAGQAVALVRRLAAYELIYIVVKDNSCYVKTTVK